MDLGYFLAIPILILLIFVFLGRFPRRMKVLTLLLPLVYIVQVLAVWSRADVPLFSALHPVMALIDFVLGLTLAWRATTVIRADTSMAARALPVGDPASG